MKKLRFTLIVLIVVPSAVFAQQKSIEFEHVFDGTFDANSITNVRWMNDGDFYTATEGKQIIRYNITNAEKDTLFDGSRFTDDHTDGIPVQGYQFSADEQKILIKTDVESIWRRSTRENYYVYDRQADSLFKLTKSGGKQQYAEFSPAGDKVAFVRDNNLFWIDLSSGEVSQITEDGALNSIINGATDWVYEEEFGFAKAWFWSPDGNRIAFYRFDESDVKEFFFTEWGGIYPDLVRYKYPKAGQKNSVVQVGVYHLQEDTTVWMDTGDEPDQYIPRINWTNDSNLLAIRRMNRLQNKQELLFANVTTGETSMILAEERQNGWIPVHDNLHFLENGQQFLWTSERDGFNHIYLYNMQGELINQVTSGNWEVDQFLGYDERSYQLFYTSTEVSSMQRHLYSIRIDGKRKKPLTTAPGWHRINMSRDYKYYIDMYSDTDLPTTYTLYRADGREVRSLETNDQLRKRLNEFAYSPKEFFTVQVNGAELNAYMIKPPDFDSTKKYPLLMYVYGGPGSQTVTRSFEGGQRGMWHQYLANRGYIVVSVDNRGTGGKGRDFKQQTYKMMGQKESADQAAAARYFASLDYIDGSRIGIWGWSYGGYMSTLSLEEGNDVFSMAIAVAPFTWRYYDTIYTERYMQTPQLNPEAFDTGSPIKNAGKIKGDYLLIHGTADDNVHFQTAVELIDALIDAGVQFDLMIYPNRNHGIYGGNTREHLYRRMSSFMLEKL